MFLTKKSLTFQNWCKYKLQAFLRTDLNFLHLDEHIMKIF